MRHHSRAPRTHTHAPTHTLSRLCLFQGASTPEASSVYVDTKALRNDRWSIISYLNRFYSKALSLHHLAGNFQNSSFVVDSPTLAVNNFTFSSLRYAPWVVKRAPDFSWSDPRIFLTFVFTHPLWRFCYRVTLVERGSPHSLCLLESGKVRVVVSFQLRNKKKTFSVSSLRKTSGTMRAR